MDAKTTDALIAFGNACADLENHPQISNCGTVVLDRLSKSDENFVDDAMCEHVSAQWRQFSPSQGVIAAGFALAAGEAVLPTE